MKKRIFLLGVIFVLIALAIAWPRRDAVLRRVLEIGINRALTESFSGSIRLSRAHLSRRGRIQIDSLQATWKTPGGAFPVALAQMTSENSLVNILRDKPTVFSFNGLRPGQSQSEGLFGKLTVTSFSKGEFLLEADVRRIGLEEVAVLDPVNLKGSRGELVGKLYLKTGKGGAQKFQVDLLSEEPGGRIQARFFQLLLPYLPQANVREVLQRIGSGNETVAYKRAKLVLKLASPEKLKMVLNILVPEYNLNLNLNAEFLVEEEGAFSKIAQIMGWLKVEKP